MTGLSLFDSSCSTLKFEFWQSSLFLPSCLSLHVCGCGPLFPSYGLSRCFVNVMVVDCFNVVVFSSEFKSVNYCSLCSSEAL